MSLINFSKIIVFTALILCFWMGYEIWTTPIAYSGVEIIDAMNGTTIENELVHLKTFREVSGLGMLPLVIPILITFLAVWAVCKSKNVVLISSSFVMLVFCFVTGFSIGMAFLPVVALLMLTAVVNLTGNWLKNKAMT